MPKSLSGESLGSDQDMLPDEALESVAGGVASNRAEAYAQFNGISGGGGNGQNNQGSKSGGRAPKGGPVWGTNK